jgi:hypothetical protein
MIKLFVDGGAEFSFTWDAWSCQGNLERQFIACTGHALNSNFDMLCACMFVKRITGKIFSSDRVTVLRSS